MSTTAQKSVWDWRELPNVDWPHDLSRPTVQEITDAALYVSSHDKHVDGVMTRQVKWAAMMPWLVTYTRMSGIEICQAMGRADTIRKTDAWARVMVSPAGQAIAHAMSKRLREIVRTRMEQTQ